MIANKFSKILLASVFVSLVTSCATAKFTDLPLKNSDFTNKKITAYQEFGFEYDAGYDDSIPVGVKNIGNDNPTEFSVNLFIGNNDNCKFIYLDPSKSGKKIKETKSASFKTYLSKQNILLKAICVGKESNINYKIVAKADGIQYTRVGNLSYLAESKLI